MLEKDEEVIHEKIIALQKDFVSARREFVHLKALSKEKQSEWSAVSLELKTALRDLSIGDKGIRNAENEIAVLKKKVSEMDGNLEFVEQELRKTDEEVSALTAKKNEFSEELTAMTRQFQQTMDAYRKSEEDRREILSSIEALKAQKSALSTEISGMLSRASIRKEEDEKELDAFSMDFGKMALEREETKALLLKSEEILSPLRDEMAELERKCTYIEEIVLLEKEKASLEIQVEKLEQETRTVRDESNALEEALSRKEAELKTILSERMQKEALVEMLSKEVQVFDDLAVRAAQSEEILSDSDSLIEKEICELKKLFTDGMGDGFEFGPEMEPA